MNQELTDMICLHGWLLGHDFPEDLRISLAKTIKKAYPKAILSHGIMEDLKNA